MLRRLARGSCARSTEPVGRFASISMISSVERTESRVHDQLPMRDGTLLRERNDCCGCVALGESVQAKVLDWSGRVHRRMRTEADVLVASKGVQWIAGGAAEPCVGSALFLSRPQ